MKTIALALVAAVVLVAAGYFIGNKLRQPTDPVNAILTQMRTRVAVNHERWVSVWYRACPEVRGKNPTMLVTWAAQLNYALPVASLDLQVENIPNGPTRLKVSAPTIEVTEPTVPSDWVDALSTRSIFTPDESALVDAEKGRASPIARYISQLYLRKDDAKSIEREMTRELSNLLRDLAGVLGLGPVDVQVSIAQPEGSALPAFPAVPLCAGTAPAVNGVRLHLPGVPEIGEALHQGEASMPVVETARRFPSAAEINAQISGDPNKKYELPELEPSLGQAYGSVLLEYAEQPGPQ